MVKNKMYVSLIQGGGWNVKTKEQKQILRRYNDICIAELLGISIQQVRDMPSDYYNDLILITRQRSSLREIENKKMMQQNKAKRK